MSSHLLAALGPGTQLGSLSRFTPDYLAARKALHELLVFPHLDTITLGDVPDSTTNLFALVASGNSRLSDLTNINVDLARKVISYDTTLGTLLDSFTVQILVLTMQPVAKGYANQARADSESNQRFFSSVGTILITHYFTEESSHSFLNTLMLSINASQISRQNLKIWICKFRHRAKLLLRGTSLPLCGTCSR
jgi:hypothetical protein